LGFPHLIAANVLEILAALLATTRQESHQLILQGPQDVISVKDRVVNDALRFIWSESHTALSVNQLAKRLGLSARSLERRFHEALHRTVRDELFRCRLDRAHRLLRDTDRSIPDIALASGFSSHDALNRATQKADGVMTAGEDRYKRAPASPRNWSTRAPHQLRCA
jgi:transcriptional regulator GlxA family with amidase domain